MGPCAADLKKGIRCPLQGAAVHLKEPQDLPGIAGDFLAPSLHFLCARRRNGQGEAGGRRGSCCSVAVSRRRCKRSLMTSTQ